MKKLTLVLLIIIAGCSSSDNTPPPTPPVAEPPVVEPPPPPPPEPCQWDANLTADDPTCVEPPPPPEPCPWDENLTIDDPGCVEPPVEPPPPPPPPEPCPWDPNLTIDDPGCVEPPPPDPCPWDPNLTADDPSCVEPPPLTCDVTIRWTNPTHREPDENGVAEELGPTELAKLVLFAGRIPLAPDNEIAFTMDITEVYSLMWIIEDLESGTWWFRATVVDTQGLESEKSEETSKSC